MWITDKIMKSCVIFYTYTPELQRLTLGILLHMTAPNILQTFLEVKSDNKSIIKMYNISFRIGSIREYASMCDLKSR